MKLEGKSLKHDFFRFIIPSLIAQWVFTLYTMIDGLFVARGVSELALSGVNIAMPFVTLLFSVALMFAVGSSTVIAILLGKKEETQAKEVFTHVLHSMYHLPAFPMIQIASLVNKKKAGYGLDDCNAAREVRKAQVPILLIHGDADTFVPCSMCEKIYENVASDKKMLIIKGAAHAESYYKDMKAYEQALDEFIGGLIK